MFGTGTEMGLVNYQQINLILKQLFVTLLNLSTAKILKRKTYNKFLMLFLRLCYQVIITL